MNKPQPTLAGFTHWIYTAMGVPAVVLPSDSPWIGYAFDVAVALVNPQLLACPGPIYMLAVYNLGGDNLVNWCPDQIGADGEPINPNPQAQPDDAPPLGYFAQLRKDWDLNGFVPGVISSAYDNGTGESMEVQEQLKSLTIGQLQNAKTPWGRQYLAFAQMVGTMWGIS